jgi:hypothetical protein
VRQIPRKWLTALGVLGAALGLAGSAAAEPRPGVDRSELRRQLADLQRRARELDEKIRRVEAELAREAAARVAPRPEAPARPSMVNCMLPFYLDSAGIKHLRPDCAEITAQAACDPPYRYNEQGVRHFLPACTAGAPPPARAAE